MGQERRSLPALLVTARQRDFRDDGVCGAFRVGGRRDRPPNDQIVGAGRIAAAGVAIRF